MIIQSFPEVIFAIWPTSLTLAVGCSLRFPAFLKFHAPRDGWNVNLNRAALKKTFGKLSIVPAETRNEAAEGLRVDAAVH